MEDIQKIRPSLHQHDQNPYERTEGEAARTGPAQVSTGPLHTYITPSSLVFL